MSDAPPAAEGWYQGTDGKWYQTAVPPKKRAVNAGRVFMVAGLLLIIGIVLGFTGAHKANVDRVNCEDAASRSSYQAGLDCMTAGHVMEYVGIGVAALSILIAAAGFTLNDD